MPQDLSFSPAQRPEPDLPGSWGLYSARQDRWLDVVFASEREAEEAIAVLKRSGSKRR